MLCPPGLVCCRNFVTNTLLGFPSKSDIPHASSIIYSGSKFSREKSTFEHPEKTEIADTETEEPYRTFSNSDNYEPNTESAILNAVYTTSTHSPVSREDIRRSFVPDFYES